MIVWLTGPSGAGKTTLAKALMEEIPCVNLDGNEMRDSISLKPPTEEFPDGEPLGFTKEERRGHNLRVARLAKVLGEQSTVVVSVIAPMASAREEITEVCDPLWIYLKRKLPEREGHFYEEPKFEIVHIMLDVDKMQVSEEVKFVRNLIDEPEEPASMLIGRYQPLHDGHVTLINRVLAEGRKVVVALRDTKYSPSDPYTVSQRKQMFKNVFGSRIKVIVVPDITELVYGRKVGWEIRQLTLPDEIEKISATSIREGMNHGTD